MRLFFKITLSKIMH